MTNLCIANLAINIDSTEANRTTMRNTTQLLLQSLHYAHGFAVSAFEMGSKVMAAKEVNMRRISKFSRKPE